ncbi:hypothetical protein J6590_069953 [Homalodisca vitripennis]|nr:hypothetical protein J6590_069953 [Homalodisca vitripennis]
MRAYTVSVTCPATEVWFSELNAYWRHATREGEPRRTRSSRHATPYCVRTYTCISCVTPTWALALLIFWYCIMQPLPIRNEVTHSRSLRHGTQLAPITEKENVSLAPSHYRLPLCPRSEDAGAMST